MLYGPPQSLLLVSSLMASPPPTQAVFSHCTHHIAPLPAGTDLGAHPHVLRDEDTPVPEGDKGILENTTISFSTMWLGVGLKALGSRSWLRLPAG